MFQTKGCKLLVRMVHTRSYVHTHVHAYTDTHSASYAVNEPGCKEWSKRLSLELVHSASFVGNHSNNLTHTCLYTVCVCMQRFIYTVFTMYIRRDHPTCMATQQGWVTVATSLIIIYTGMQAILWTNCSTPLRIPYLSLTNALTLTTTLHYFTF